MLDMMIRLNIIKWAILVVLAVMPIACHGQGTAADYARQEQLKKNAPGTVYRNQIKPNWFGGNRFFWYRVATGRDHHEYVLVDVAKGERHPAFDHAQLAQALLKAGVSNATPVRLVLEGLSFSEDCATAEFRTAGRAWKYGIADNTLSPVEMGDKMVVAAGLKEVPRASSRTGEEVNITFSNQTKDTMELFWLDDQGERHGYGKIKPGEERQQHTFAGHVWLAVNQENQVQAAFEASEDAPLLSIKDGERPQEHVRHERSSAPRLHPSPDGKWAPFIKDHNLWVRENREGGSEFALTTDGNDKDEYNEPFYWSPDSTRLVVMKTAEGDKRMVSIVESSPKDQLQPKLHTFEYAKPGDRLPVPRPHLFDVPNKQAITVATNLCVNPYSVSDVRWAPDSTRFTFLYNQRGHQVFRVIGVDARNGETRALVDEQSGTFIDYAQKNFAHFIDPSGELIWMSERDGWNHLYLYDLKSGQVKNQVTKGAWVVRRVERVDEQARQIWFFAGGIRPDQDPYYLHFCRVNFDGTGLVVLTEGDGNHAVDVAPDRQTFIDTWSRVDQTPVIELRRMSDGTRVCELERADWHDLLETGWRAPERFVAKGRDGTTDIYGIIIRPSNFDSAKKYPVVEEIYAGPQGSFVPKGFGLLLRQQGLAQLGFIVVQIDGMGTSDRSKAFHNVCWKNLADAGFPDRILWMKAAAARYPEMDLTRVGIYGGSAGGQNALGALLTHGEFYKVAVADCGCHDNRMDKIWWNELWMGWPIGKHYEECSNVTLAPRLQGKLLLIVGEMDHNVDPASTMQVVNALVKADKDFDLLVIPGSDHGAAESPYGQRRRMDFLVRHLLGVEPRS